MKKYINTSIIYAVLAMVFGVFYREFTKFSGFTGVTTLSYIHTHYFVLGMIMFLVLLLLEKNFQISNSKNLDKKILSYNIGLNLSVLMLFIRGFTQVQGTVLSKGMDAAISGMAGLGHIILGVSMIMILLNIKKTVE